MISEAFAAMTKAGISGQGCVDACVIGLYEWSPTTVRTPSETVSSVVLFPDKQDILSRCGWLFLHGHAACGFQADMLLAAASMLLLVNGRAQHACPKRAPRPEVPSL